MWHVKKALSIPTLSLFLSQLQRLPYPYLGFPSKAAMSSSALAATMARANVWRRGREVRGDRQRAAAAAEGGDKIGSLLGATLRLSTLLALAPTAARCVRDEAMGMEAESEDGMGEEIGRGASLRSFSLSRCRNGRVWKSFEKVSFSCHFLLELSLDEKKSSIGDAAALAVKRESETETAHARAPPR